MLSILFYLILQPVHTRMISQRKKYMSMMQLSNVSQFDFRYNQTLDSCWKNVHNSVWYYWLWNLYKALIRKGELRTRLYRHWSKELDKKKKFCKVYGDLKSEMRKWKVARLNMLRTSIYAVRARLDRLYASCSFEINVNQKKDKSLENSSVHKSCFKNFFSITHS